MNNILIGWKLVLARLLWFAVAAVTLVTLVAALPVRVSYLSETLLPPIFGNAGGPFGSTPESVAIYITTGEILLGFLVWFTIGAFVFWRKSEDGLVIFFSAMMVAAAALLHSSTATGASETRWKNCRPSWSSLGLLRRRLELW